MHGYAITAGQGSAGIALQRVTLAGIAAPAQHTKIGTVVRATMGKRNDVVNGQIVGPVIGHAVARTPTAVPCPVLCHHLLSYYSVGTGVPTLASTATLPLTPCHVLGLAYSTAGRVGSQTPAHQAGTLSHGPTATQPVAPAQAPVQPQGQAPGCTCSQARQG
jgi:hypothetical protein